MCVNKEEIQAMIDARFIELETRIKEGDNLTYHKLSDLIHQMSPKTREAIASIEVRFAEHVSREEEHWKKIDEIVTVVREKLLPVYVEEEQKKNAKKYISKQLGTFSSVSGKVLAIGSLFAGTLWVLKLFISHI